MIVETTPLAVTARILEFCRGIDPTTAPIYVPVQPEPECIVDDCFFNVADEVALRGGNIQYGWIIWEFPTILLAAEFHAVLEREGRLLDITPKRDGEERILFLPDSTRKYELHPVLPIRTPLTVEGEILCKYQGAAERLRHRYFVAPAIKGGALYAAPDDVVSEIEQLNDRASAARSKALKKSLERQKRLARLRK
jgi:hypothetical protein